MLARCYLLFWLFIHENKAPPCTGLALLSYSNTANKKNEGTLPKAATRQGMDDGSDFDWAFVFSKLGTRVMAHQRNTMNICWGELPGCKTHRGAQLAAHKPEGCSEGLRCQRKAVKCLQLGSMSLSYFSFAQPCYSDAAAQALFTFQSFCERVIANLPPFP